MNAYRYRVEIRRIQVQTVEFVADGLGGDRIARVAHAYSDPDRWWDTIVEDTTNLHRDDLDDTP